MDNSLLSDEMIETLEASFGEDRAVCRIHNRLGPQSWILLDKDPESDTFTCIADLGFGISELGSVLGQELEEVAGMPEVDLELDVDFQHVGEPAEFFL